MTSEVGRRVSLPTLHISQSATGASSRERDTEVQTQCCIGSAAQDIQSSGNTGGN